MNRFSARLLAILSLSFMLTGCLVYEVDPGNLVRSPQPNRTQLEAAIDQYGIRTVINLRGENPGQKWFDDETAVTEERGVKLVNIPMSAKRLPHRKHLLQLLDAYKNAPRPILLHCLGGVDRTGEAAALYEMIYLNKSKAEALKMLSIKFAHIEARMPAKKYFISQVWKDQDWAYRDYSPCSGEYQYYDVSDSACTNTESEDTIRLTEDEDT